MAIIKINGHHGTQSFATAEDVQSVTNLDNLHDVIITGLANGQYLIYNSSVQQWQNTTPPVIDELSELTDVTITGLADGQFLVYDSATSQWENSTVSITPQTLSFASPDLSILNGNSVDLSALITGLITASSTDTLTNKSGSNSQWTNDEAFIKADSTDTLTNKSGNISMFTNDAGYITSETDSQTLTFTSPNSLAISNGNTVNLSTLEVGEIDGGSY